MATKRWIGNASTVSDLWTATLSGTVTSQTFSMTINGKSISYVAGGSDAVATVLAGLVANWNSLSPSPPPEFQELTAAVASLSTMTLTGNTPGKPSTLSVATSGGATFTITNTMPATGPNDFANGQNWSGGSAPANSDTLVFDTGSTACKYGLSTSLTGIALDVLPGFTGTIGLPIINSDSNTTYAEYRTTALTLTGGTVTINGPSMTRCNLAFGANTATVQVTATGTRPDRYTPTVLITGGNSSSALSITKGDVALANYLGQTANFSTILTSFQSNPASDVTLFCGPGATLGAITKNGGNLTINSNVTTLLQGTGGGATTISAGAVSTLNVEAGTCIYNSTGTLGTVTISGGAILDFSQDPNGKTISNPILVYGDKASVNDPAKVVNSGTLSVTTEQTTFINVSHGSGSVMTFA